MEKGGRRQEVEEGWRRMEGKKREKGTREDGG